MDKRLSGGNAPHAVQHHLAGDATEEDGVHAEGQETLRIIAIFGENDEFGGKLAGNCADAGIFAQKIRR